MTSDEVTKKLWDFKSFAHEYVTPEELENLLTQFREAILQEAKEDAIEEINRRVYGSSLKSHI